MFYVVEVNTGHFSHALVNIGWTCLKLGRCVAWALLSQIKEHGMNSK